jgi:hypothetical protein
MRIPKPERRIVHTRDTITKGRLIDIMCELEPELTKVAAAKAYDRVTAAINGWIMSASRALPKGLHARLRLANCFSVNLCWLKGKPDKYPDYPSAWMTLGDRGPGRPGPRGYLRRLRYDEWKRWNRTRMTFPPSQEGEI